MSSSQLSTINFSGGLPSHKDLAPAIIFIIAFGALLGIWVWRVALRRSRSMALFRLGIFMFIQEGFLVTRVILAVKAPDLPKGLTIANLVLVLAGTLLLLEPPIWLWSNYVSGYTVGKGKMHWVRLMSIFLQLLLLGAIGIATYTGSAVGSLLSDPTASKLSTFRSLRLASYILALAIVVILAAGIVATHVHYRLEAKKTGFLLASTGGVFVICVFRMISGETTDSSAPSRSKAAFWILQVFLSWAVCALMLSINLRAWFPSASDLAKEAERGGMGELESGRKGSSTSSDLPLARR